MENSTDADYKHVKRIWQDFRIQNLGKYHDLYGQSDTLLLADVFKSFCSNCIEIFELDPVLSTRISMAVIPEKDRIKNGIADRQT